MIYVDEKRVITAGSRAQQIASLCRFLSDALGANPDTANASEAIDGVEKLAADLSDDLLTMAEARP
jgi:hypothetical protein